MLAWLGGCAAPTPNATDATPEIRPGILTRLSGTGRTAGRRVPDSAAAGDRFSGTGHGRGSEPLYPWPARHGPLDTGPPGCRTDVPRRCPDLRLRHWLCHQRRTHPRPLPHSSPHGGRRRPGQLPRLPSSVRIWNPPARKSLPCVRPARSRRIASWRTKRWRHRRVAPPGRFPNPSAGTDPGLAQGPVPRRSRSRKSQLPSRM